MSLNRVQLCVAGLTLALLGCEISASRRMDPGAGVGVGVFAATIPVKINFQPEGVMPPDGYLVDTGLVFGDRGNGYLYGWDVDNSAAARERKSARSPDILHDTFLHLQKPLPDVKWEIAVPDGIYNVHVVSGDPDNYDSDFQLKVEEEIAIAGVPDETTSWFDKTVRVIVADGLLTVSNGPAAMNNKINYIEISSSGTMDPVPPPDAGAPAPAPDAAAPTGPTGPPPSTGPAVDARPGPLPGPITTPGSAWGCSAAGPETPRSPWVLALLGALAAIFRPRRRR
jgi:MYXO-CTERM domain-containing protein